MSDYATVTSDDFTVTTNTADEAGLREALTPEPVEPESPAAVAAEPPAEAEPIAEPTTDKPKTAKPRNDPQARIDQAIARQKDAERKAADLEARLAALEAGTAAKPATADPVAAAPAKPDAEPDPTDLAAYPDGQFDRQYLKDQARWEARQEFQAQQQRAQAAAASDARQADASKALDTFNGKMAAVLTADPEFLDRVDPDVKGKWPLSALSKAQLETLQRACAAGDPQALKAAAEHSVAEHIIRADQPEKWLAHFTAHKDDYQRLLTLPPEAFYRTLGKLEARLDAAVVPASASTAKPSTAKPPIKPVGSSPALADDEPSDDEPFDAHFARENARERKAQGRR